MRAWILVVIGSGLGQLACTSENPAYVAGQPCGPTAPGCGAGTVCDSQAQICTCPSGAALCGEVCAVLASDPQHCGACGLSCPAGESCANGRCSGGKCATGALDCGGLCVDPKSNAQHCGGCASAGGHRCGDGQLCSQRTCIAQPCAFGAARCGQSCVDLRSSPTDCGACGRTCSAGELCAGGRCVGACPPGLRLCGSECADLAHNPNHCGHCGERCGHEEVCGREGHEIKCRDYRYAGCNTCPCASCGDRRCCVVPNPAGGYATLCVEGECPAL